MKELSKNLGSNEVKQKVEEGLQIFKGNDKNDWKTVLRPGYFGKKRDELYQMWNKKYGKDNWRIAYTWGDKTISKEIAIQIYEDAYYEFFKNNSEKLNWLLSTASDIYDTSPSNILAGLSYNHQETPNNHIHDVSIRRSILRLGKNFRGDRLVHVRWIGSEGYPINPGVVPFHIPEKILQPRIDGWWNPDTVEDFYQSNKVLQIKGGNEK